MSCILMLLVLHCSKFITPLFTADSYIFLGKFEFLHSPQSLFKILFYSYVVEWLWDVLLDHLLEWTKFGVLFPSWPIVINLSPRALIPFVQFLSWLLKFKFFLDYIHGCEFMWSSNLRVYWIWPCSSSIADGHIFFTRVLFVFV